MYRASDYQRAFHDYGEACYYMAQYNNIQYNRVLRKVIDALFAMPSQEIDLIVDKLVAYWSSQRLDQDYPDFVRSCQEVKFTCRILDIRQLHAYASENPFL